MNSEPASERLWKLAKRYTPGGVHSGARYREPHPRFFARAEGPFIWDVDGNRWIDCVMSNGAVALGHGRKEVMEAVKASIDKGLTCGVESEACVEAARKVVAMFPTSVQVRFCNSGTEAAMNAARLARAYTGRSKIAKVEAGYHGWADQFMVSTWPDLKIAGPSNRPNSLPGTRGMGSGVLDATVVLPWNDAQAACSILDEVGDQVAALFIEPILIDIGYIPPQPGFLETLREITKRKGILLVFDEILTGFRVARGGAQELFGIVPDLFMIGKAMSNGFPISAVGGRPDVLDLFNPEGGVAFNGTFNGHQMSVAAVSACMDVMLDWSVMEQVDKMTRELGNAFAGAAERHGVAAVFQGGGGHFNVYFTTQRVVDYRSAATTDRSKYQVFSESLQSQGIHFQMNPLLHHALSSAHNEEVVDAIAKAMDIALLKVASAGAD